MSKVPKERSSSNKGEAKRRRVARVFKDKVGFYVKVPGLKGVRVYIKGVPPEATRSQVQQSLVNSELSATYVEQPSHGPLGRRIRGITTVSKRRGRTAVVDTRLSAAPLPRGPSNVFGPPGRAPGTLFAPALQRPLAPQVQSQAINLQFPPGYGWPTQTEFARSAILQSSDPTETLSGQPIKDPVGSSLRAASSSTTPSRTQAEVDDISRQIPAVFNAEQRKSLATLLGVRDPSRITSARLSSDFPNIFNVANGFFPIGDADRFVSGRYDPVRADAIRERIFAIANQQFASGRGPVGEGTTNHELDQVMAPFKERGYQNAISIDEVDSLKPGKRISTIVNLAPASKPGTHWVALHIDARTGSDQAIEYYDSFAKDPPAKFVRDLKNLVDKINPKMLLKFKVNRVVDQKVTTDTCGIHAAMFLEGRMNGVPFKEVTGYNQAKAEGKADIFRKTFKLV